MSLNIQNLGAGKGFIKISAIFSAAGIYIIYSSPHFKTYSQIFYLMSIYFVLDFRNALPIVKNSWPIVKKKKRWLSHKFFQVATSEKLVASKVPDKSPLPFKYIQISVEDNAGIPF